MFIAAIRTQFFPPGGSAPLTKANLPLQHGKVFTVTGSSSGLGYELTRILYVAGGKVYMLTRSKENAEAAMANIKALYSSIESIGVDLMDLNSVKRAAQAFLSWEERLDILFNNVGTSYEYYFSINFSGGFLLTCVLSPALSQTARNLLTNSVRVVWPPSILVEMMSPNSGINPHFLKDSRTAWVLASEFVQQQSLTNKPVVFIAGTPGNYITNIWRYTPAFLYYILRPILRNPVLTVEEAQAGAYAIYDGRWHPAQRSDLVLALRTPAEGSSGRARKLFN
ncbi:putative steroid dehydrogenase [Xylariaceae sp. FL1651]|nr:putative steroid dehydrogenase [Xylariaceae sp. FL1651]